MLLSRNTNLKSNYLIHIIQPIDMKDLEQSTEPQVRSSSNDSTEYGAFPPGTIVLAKLKSFPPWPAIIIPSDLVPQDILKSKPKKPSSASSGSRRSKRKTSTPASTNSQADDFNVWCVRFLRDDTYMWATVNDLKLLTSEQIQTALDKWKTGKNKLLKSAYEMALNPPDVEDFIIWGSDGKPIQIDNEADDEDFQVDDDEDAEEEEDVEEEEEIEDDLEDVEETPQPRDSKKRGKPAPKATAKRQKSSTPKKATRGSSAVSTPKKTGRGRTKGKTPVQEDPETSGDEDWEDDVDEFEEIDIIEGYVPTSKEYADLLKKNKPFINKIVIHFTSAFLEEEKLNVSNDDFKTLNGLLDQLAKVQETVPKSLLVKNNVHKLFIAILERNDLKQKNCQLIRGRIQEFLSFWFDITVEVNKYWRLEPEEEEEDEDVVEVKETSSSVKNETENNTESEEKLEPKPEE